MVYLTGADGFIGKALVQAGYKPLICNVVDYNSVDRAIHRSSPSLVLHLAGVSDPDACESHPEKASKVNVRGTHNVMENCARRRIPAVLLSSAQIWGGGWWESLWNRHSEDSKLTPAANSYGMQKVAAEAVTMFSNIDDWNKMKIVRTSYVFGKDRLASRMRNLERGVSLDAPRFIKRSFIYIGDFVAQIQEYCNRFNDMPPILHLAGSQTVSYYDFWLEICRQYGFSKSLVLGRRVRRDFLYSAKRPHNAGLDVSLSKRLGLPQFDYIGGIERMKNEN